MNKDTAEDILAYEASRMMTQMYLISAEDEETGINLRRFVEAISPTHAEQIWLTEVVGFYDADPKHSVDLMCVTIVEVPTAYGHPGIIDLGHAL